MDRYICKGPCYASWSVEYVEQHGGKDAVEEAHKALSKSENRHLHILKLDRQYDLE